MLTGQIVKTKDWLWDVTLTYTRNRNKIIELAPGVTKYRLGGSIDVEAWATEGGAYGDLYTSYGYKRDENGNKILNGTGQWIRNGESEKVGSIQPDFLGGLTTSLSWKGITLSAVLDARFGGDILSASYNYGMASGSLQGSLNGRPGHGGLARGLADGRVVNDGMLPDGVFQDGITINGVDVSGKTYEWAYHEGLVQPVSAYKYYNNLYEWSTGIREASIFTLSWVAIRELSVYWDLPREWTNRAFIKGAQLGFVVRNVGYLYNSLPDNIHPEGLKSNASYEFVEAGGSVYSRNFGVKLNINF